MESSSGTYGGCRRVIFLRTNYTRYNGKVVKTIRKGETMDKDNNIGMFLLMAVGAIIGGIGGAATVSELPENWSKLKRSLGKKESSDSDESE